MRRIVATALLAFVAAVPAAGRAAPGLVVCTWGGTPDAPTGWVETTQGITTVPVLTPTSGFATGALHGDGCTDEHGADLVMTFHITLLPGSSCTSIIDTGTVTGVPGINYEETLGETGLVEGVLYGPSGPAGTWNAQVFTGSGKAADCAGNGFGPSTFSGTVQIPRG